MTRIYDRTRVLLDLAKDLAVLRPRRRTKMTIDQTRRERLARTIRRRMDARAWRIERCFEAACDPFWAFSLDGSADERPEEWTAARYWLLRDRQEADAKLLRETLMGTAIGVTKSDSRRGLPSSRGRRSGVCATAVANTFAPPQVKPKSCKLKPA
jgi:hypothetical protein